MFRLSKTEDGSPSLSLSRHTKAKSPIAFITKALAQVEIKVKTGFFLESADECIRKKSRFIIYVWGQNFTFRHQIRERTDLLIGDWASQLVS